MSEGTIGINALREVYLKLSTLGTITITATPHASDPEIMSVDAGATNRKGAVHMDTNKEENVDQFVGRLKGMMRALWNEEVKEKEGEVVKVGGSKK